MNRRGFLGAAAGAPFAAPAMAKQVMHDMRSGQAVGIPSGYALQDGYTVAQQMPTTSMIRRVLANSEARRDIMSRLFRDHQQVNHIDPDIQILRSVSPMAKIAFQRQRNVEREFARMESAFGDPVQSAWSALHDYLGKL